MPAYYESIKDHSIDEIRAHMMSLEMSSQTHPEVSFTNSLGVSNQMCMITITADTLQKELLL